MDTTFLTISIFVASTVLAVLGFFLRTVYLDVRKDIDILMNNDNKRAEELGKLKGKIEIVQVENQLKYQAIQELTQLEIKNLAKNVADLSTAVKELIMNK